MSHSTKILDLTDDSLLCILKHCDVETLGRIALTCKRMNNIIKNYDSIWISKSRTVLGSNMLSPIMVQRSMPVLNPMDRCRVSRNWVSGHHNETSVMRYSKCMPWICLEQDFLYISKKSTMNRFNRDEDIQVPHRRISATSRHKDDISNFVINGEEIISVGWDGRLCRYNKSNLVCYRAETVHNNTVNALDAKNDIIVTGSRDETIKIWKTTTKKKPIIPVSEFNTSVRVLSLSLLPSMRYLVAGLTAKKEIPPLPVYDIEKEKLIFNLGKDHRRGAGIMDLYPEDNNLILSCGYDSTVKLWDLRTPQKHVAEWMEPYDNFLYCVKSDHNITIISGASRSGYFHIWDKRAQTVIQTHYTREYGSPVYCLAFDASHVFTALSRAVMQYCFI